MPTYAGTKNQYFKPRTGSAFFAILKRRHLRLSFMPFYRNLFKNCSKVMFLTRMDIEFVFLNSKPPKRRLEKLTVDSREADLYQEVFLTRGS